MKIEIYQQKKGRLIVPRRLIERIIGKVLTALKKPRKGELSIAFVSDQEMRKLNRQWLGRRGTTDVLSFNGDDHLLGEIVINIKTARYKINRLIVHGVLSLFGLDHKNQGVKVEKLEDKILSKV